MPWLKTSSITLRSSSLRANSPARGTPRLLRSSWPLVLSWTSTRIVSLANQFRMHHLDAGPADAAGALNLAAFERERDLAAAGIAGDDAEFGAEHVVQQQRQVVGGGARIARADDQLLVEHVLERLHRGIAAHVADIDVAVGAAEIDELVRIVLHRHVAQQRLQHGAGEDRPDRRCRPWARPHRCSRPRGWSRRRSCSARRRSDCRGSRCRNAAPAAAHRCRSRRRPTSRRPSRSACPCRIARRIPAPSADGRGGPAGRQSRWRQAGRKTRSASNWTRVAFPSGRLIPPRIACAREGFRQGCRCQLRPISGNAAS